ncbi:DMT family transporter [Aestuariivirga sp.]|uniref:DMT family transporter n=1 Tax=Aestuariivirga sp. TaxID=2650926 RepID=UPI0039E7177E
MSRVQANFVLVLVAALWGTGNVAQQSVLEHIGPLLANGLKCAFAIPVLLPVMLKGGRSPRAMDREGWLLAALIMTSYVLGTTGYQAGFAFTSVSNAGFMVNTATVLTPIFSWWLLKEKPTRCMFLAAVMTFAGVFFIGGGSLGSFSLGDVICLGTAFCFAIWMICLGEFVRLYGRAGWITMLQFSATAIVCVGGSFAVEPISMTGIVAALPLLIFLGVIDTGFAACLQAYAQRHTSATEAAVLVSAEAIFGAAAAYLILNEHLGSLALVGALMVMAGIFIVQLFPARSQNQFTPAEAARNPA